MTSGVTESDGTLALTDEQRAAVDTPGSLVVRAGAGSGKTAVLVERYLRLVCGREPFDEPGSTAVAAAEFPVAAEDAGTEIPLRVDQVVAVTFTEKAAAEMRERIRARVGAELRRAAAGSRRDRLVRVQRELVGARISTIHALAASLLKAHPLESAVDPGARVLDEIEATAYLERETERVLLAALRAGDADVRRLAALWGLGSGRPGGGLAGVVREALGGLARQGRTPGDLLSALARQEEAAATASRALRRDAERLIALVDGWLTPAEPARAPEQAEEFRARWPAWRAALAALAPDAPVATLMALRELPGLVPRFWRRAGDGGARLDALLRFKVEQGTPRFRGAIPAAYGLCQGVPLARALTAVVRRCAQALDQAKQHDAVVTFDDLIAGAVELLARHPAVAAHEAARVAAILVDEFQDTDPAQYVLLERLAAGGAARFVVGDEKQSIYRFRGAEVALFGELRAALGRELPLADNFRSVPALLAFANGLAARLLSVPAAEPGAPAGTSPAPAPWRVRWGADQRLRPRRPAAPAGAPVVRLKSLANAVGKGEGELSAAAVRAHEARVVAATVCDLRREGRRYGEVAVLMPALTEVKAYEYALRRYGVPYQVVKGRGFFACQEVRDLTSLLAAVVDSEDGVALAGALRSPLFALGDDVLLALVQRPDGAPRRLTGRFTAAEPFDDLPAEAAAAARAARDLLVELRAACDRRSIAELLERALAATHLEAVLLGQFQGGQKVANVRKLLEQARAFQRQRGATVREFVARTRRLLASEPHEPEAAGVTAEADSVQVMTIHQAKGLEFPVVILPDLGRALPRDYRAPFVLDARYGLLVAPTFGSGRYRLPHRLIDEWRAADLTRSAAERARLLYVACTRARDLLILCEGKGRRAFLRDRAPDAPAAPAETARWCEQVWEFLGREAIAAFVASDAERVTLEAPGEGSEGEVVPVAVEVEKSGALLARVAPPEHDAGEEGIAAALGTPPGAAERGLAARVLGFRPPPPAELVVSPTALADFAACPRQFFYRHVLALPETAESGVARTAAVRMGIAAHGALEILDLGCAPAERKRAIAAALAPATQLLPAERARIAADLRAALARYADADRDLVLLGREVPFCLPLAGAPALFIRGRIDLVAARGERLLVRDYKYARPAAEGDTYRMQLEIYALAVAAALPGRTLEADVDYLRDGGGRAALAIDLAAASERVRAAGRALAAGLAAGGMHAFARAYDVPAPCRTLGCPYVRRCFAGAV